MILENDRPTLSSYCKRDASSALRFRRLRYRLDLHHVVETVPTPFAAVARVLVATERRLHIVACAVQVDVAGANARAALASALERTRIDVARQAIRRVVGDGD